MFEVEAVIWSSERNIRRRLAVAFAVIDNEAVPSSIRGWYHGSARNQRWLGLEAGCVLKWDGLNQKCLKSVRSYTKQSPLWIIGVAAEFAWLKRDRNSTHEPWLTSSCVAPDSNGWWIGLLNAASKRDEHSRAPHNSSALFLSDPVIHLTTSWSKHIMILQHPKNVSSNWKCLDGHNKGQNPTQSKPKVFLFPQRRASTNCSSRTT